MERKGGKQITLLEMIDDCEKEDPTLKKEYDGKEEDNASTD